jgi:ribosomal protein S18 acetylase RimI-like enzyme
MLWPSADSQGLPPTDQRLLFLRNAAKICLLKIVRVSHEVAPRELMMLADPSREHIESYLADTEVFLGERAGEWVAIAAVLIREGDMELKNLAVKQGVQNLGLGTLMLTYLLDYADRLGLRGVRVAISSSSVRHLKFYERLGFRIRDIERNFFEGYDPPIYENGIRFLDRLQLCVDLRIPDRSGDGVVPPD